MNAITHQASRRAFLKLSAAGGAGLVIGLNLPTPVVGSVPAGVAANAWVRIAPDDTVTVICHRNEMGQDVHTSLALLVAEELDVDVNKITVEQAPVNPV